MNDIVQEALELLEGITPGDWASPWDSEDPDMDMFMAGDEQVLGVMVTDMIPSDFPRRGLLAVNEKDAAIMAAGPRLVRGLLTALEQSQAATLEAVRERDEALERVRALEAFGGGHE